MYQRDYILNEARKFAQLLARLMGLKVDGDDVTFRQEFNAALQAEYDIAAETLLTLDEDAFTQHIENATYSPEKLNALGQLLYVYAEPLEQNDDTRLLLKKVLIIFDALERKHHFQAFENIARRNDILRFLN
ncbi:hypothetical protein C8P68_10955 [Mucilaginibacter yixingensis]|uniref:Uncharacterized protein n=1 Tax=Mucilaginibacter yixingensis TaxID=1295612 RepID=A0A2T5J5D0_9SPHI|nr:hypothetical protein [Mucilaginibacter yixingensis]PTQ93183.1 hypothetical protein C8P68_10955 [Mucilaginibacter yixingensis]